LETVEVKAQGHIKCVQNTFQDLKVASSPPPTQKAMEDKLKICFCTNPEEQNTRKASLV
jgi:hypothetical protein